MSSMIIGVLALAVGMAVLWASCRYQWRTERTAGLALLGLLLLFVVASLFGIEAPSAILLGVVASGFIAILILKRAKGGSPRNRPQLP
ncbi:hypothetical protein [Phyllobacterium myrsinacearum]|uniref:hypothetical protein n=1 Tax=Phyllobacterium myrsinacearum TaxID=28101 RepID=UPI00102A53A5|nr:hypothetical protein [Phyllobacterium myrsinacearum]